MQNIIKKNIWFLIPWLVVGIAAIIIISVTSKPDLHLSINQFHNRFLDVLMVILTCFGNGLFACGLGLILLVVKIRYSLYMLGSYAASGLVVQLIKHIAFPGALRPVPFLSPHVLHLVQGISILNNYSFPSGHAATAFSVFFICSHLITPRIVKLFMVIAAILVAFSRTYLSLHFLEDILAGSFIGILAAIVSIYLTDRIKSEWAEKTVLTLSVDRKRNGTVY